MAAWTAAVGWMAVIFALSSIPGSHLPGRWGWLGHLAAYAVLGGLLALAIGPTVPARAGVYAATLLASLYGVTDEVHQILVPGRTPDVLDWSVDTLGAVLGAGIVVWLSTKKAALRRPS